MAFAAVTVPTVFLGESVVLWEMPVWPVLRVKLRALPDWTVAVLTGAVLTALRLTLVAARLGLAGARKPPPPKPRADALVGISVVVASMLVAMSIKIEERFNMVVLLGLRRAFE